MLGWLTKIDAAAASAQMQRTAAEVQQRVEIDRAASAARPPLRGPGRPPLKREALSLSSNDGIADLTSDSDVTMAAEKEPGNSATRRYTSWLTSPLFPLIHNAVIRAGTLRGAVAALHRESLQVYGSLGYGTLQKWYEMDSDGAPHLHERFQRYLCHSNDLDVNRGRGPRSFWDSHPEATNRIRELLMRLRDGRNAGIAVGVPLLSWVVRGVLADMQIEGAPLSHSSMSRFAREIMGWSWRRRTAAARKLPDDWREQGTLTARRIAALMQSANVRPRNVVNIDQTGMQLIPSSQFTYEQRGAVSVPCGSDDKRQITAVIGSSLNGDMLPLQLVFEGKTDRSLPQHTLDSQSNGFHLTLSENHWSTLETMQQYVERVLDPWRGEEDMILVLDAWTVHRTTFREWIKNKHKQIHLVFVPANCTSMLQVADVALNRPFKAAIKTQFEEWAASVIMQQIKQGIVPNLKEHLGIKQLRPILLEWCYKSWMELRTPPGRMTVQRGWQRCVNQFLDVFNEDKRREALQACVRGEFTAFDVVPDREEAPTKVTNLWDDDEDSESEIDESKPIREGERRGKRKRAARQQDIVTSMLAMAASDDSELELSDHD